MTSRDVPFWPAPRLTADMKIGPPMKVGRTEIRYVKNDRAQTFFRVGAKEFELISCIDGTRSIAEICAAYRERTTQRISEQSASALIQQLAVRGLLQPPAGFEEALPASPVTAARRLTVPRLGEAYLRLANPERLVGAIVRAARKLNPTLVSLVVALTVLGCEAYVFAHFGELTRRLELSSARPLDVIAVTAFIAFFFLASIAHELAHACMCVWYGGRVVDMGLMYRYFTFAPYCKLDDLVVLPDARARTVTVAAGVITNIVLLLPFVALNERLRSADGSLALLSAYVLIIYNASALFNLLPFMRLDGYLLASLCRGRPEFRRDAYREMALMCRTYWESLCGISSTVTLQRSLIAAGLMYALFTALMAGYGVLTWISLARRHSSGWVMAVPVIVLLLIVYHYYDKRDADRKG